MKRAQVLSIAAVCAMAIASAACSSSSTPTPTPSGAPTVSSIAISGGNAQSAPDADAISTTTDTTTNVSTATTSIAVTFSTDMTVSTVTASNVTLTCASGTAPTLGEPTTTDDTTFTFAVTGTFPQLISCTLAFSTSITNSSGTAMAATETAFTTGCSTADTFGNAATIVASTGCWTTNNATGSMDATEGTLTVTGLPAGSDIPLFSKTFTAGVPETISVVVEAAPTETDAACLLGISNDAIDSGGMIALGQDGSVIQLTLGGGDPTSMGMVTAPLTLTLVYDGTSTITPSFTTSGGATTEGTAITGLDLGTSPIMALGIGGNPAAAADCIYSNFTSTVSATEPNPTGTTGGQD